MKMNPLRTFKSRSSQMGKLVYSKFCEFLNVLVNLFNST